jgi:hypothetical protein
MFDDDVVEVFRCPPSCDRPMSGTSDDCPV